MAGETIEDIGDRLRRFLQFARPKLNRDGGLDEPRLRRWRNMSDLRLQDVAVKQPQISLAHLAKLLTYTPGAPSFPTLALETKLLTLEQVALPMPHDSQEVGIAIDAILLQNALSAEKLKAVLAEFVAVLAAAPPKPKVEPPPAPSQVKLPPKVEALLGQVKGLWAIPSNVAKLQALLGHVETQPEEIAREVELDPGLTAQVLRVVNSAHYIGDTKVAGIEAAVTRIGFKMMRRIVTVAGMIQVLGKPLEDVEVDLKSFWGHSLWVAHAASLICEEKKLGEADAFFSSGLLHDVGKLVIYQHLQARLKLILQGVRQGQPFEKVEPAVLGGINHAAIGSTLCEVWKLPQEVIEAARHHLDGLVMLESFQISQEAKVVGAVCALHASRAPVEQVARFLKVARDPLEAIRKEAFERSIASLRELFQLM